MLTNFDRIQGCIVGCAIGDALGLPREGLRPERARRLFGNPPLEHRLIFRRGMISDDTDHLCMTAQALIASRGDPQHFASSLAWRLRGWVLGLPAGIGMATLKAILKLWLGFPPQRSGVRSAGNGPAMRAPIIGLFASTDDQLAELVRTSTVLTHTDPRAFEGAWLIAFTTRHIARHPHLDINHFANFAIPRIQDTQLRDHLQTVFDAINAGQSAIAVAKTLGLSRGVTGFINHTVPIAIFCALRHHNEPRTAMEEAIMLGGDTDTVAAIVGAILGTIHGPAAFPASWRDRLCDYPRSLTWCMQLAQRLHEAQQTETQPLPLAWPLLPLRNLVFLLIVLAHGFRRLFPPY